MHAQLSRVVKYFAVDVYSDLQSTLLRSLVILRKRFQRILRPVVRTSQSLIDTGVFAENPARNGMTSSGPWATWSWNSHFAQVTLTSGRRGNRVPAVAAGGTQYPGRSQPRSRDYVAKSCWRWPQTSLRGRFCDHSERNCHFVVPSDYSRLIAGRKSPLGD